MMQLDLSEVEKSKKFDFSKNVLFLAISKLRLSTYTCTPSGNPKLKFWLSLPIPKLFPYPLNNVGMLKNSGTHEKGKITYQKYANDAVKFISCGKIKNLIFQKKYFSCYQQTSPLDVPMYAFG